MNIKSIRHRIRWKGHALGKPSIEVRIEQNGKPLANEEILKRIRAYSNVSRLVFTGTEPMLDQLDLLNIIQQMQSGWDIIIETTGGIMPDLFIRDKVMWEIHPPKEGITMPFTYSQDALRAYSNMKNTIFEWDVTGETDLLEVKKAQHFMQIPWKRIILAVRTETYDDFKERFSWLESFCIAHGCSLGNPLILNMREDGNHRRDTEVHTETPTA